MKSAPRNVRQASSLSRLQAVGDSPSPRQAGSLSDIFRGEAMDKTDNKNRANKTEPDVSRRKFITKAMAGAGATTIIAFGENKANAADTAENRPIKIPDEFAQAAQA